MALDEKAKAEKETKEAADAAEKAAIEKAKADREAVDAAAKDAKANELQIAKDQKAAAEEALKVPVLVVGRAGGAFSIDGPGLGSNGSLTIGGRHIETTRWDDKTIRGQLPQGVKGDVVLTLSTGVRHGVFPPPLVMATTTTVTTVSTEQIPSVEGAHAQHVRSQAAAGHAVPATGHTAHATK